MSDQMYELRLTAIGVVRDADGNVISEQPIESTVILTEDEARALLTQGDQS